MFVSNYNQDFITNKNVKLTVTRNPCLIKETKILSIRGSKTTEESQKFCVPLSLQGAAAVPGRHVQKLRFNFPSC